MPSWQATPPDFDFPVFGCVVLVLLLQDMRGGRRTVRTFISKLTKYFSPPPCRCKLGLAGARSAGCRESGCGGSVLGDSVLVTGAQSVCGGNQTIWCRLPYLPGWRKPGGKMSGVGTGICNVRTYLVLQVGTIYLPTPDSPVVRVLDKYNLWSLLRS